MGVLTLFPFDQWGHEHSIHHATSGNLDKRVQGIFGRLQLMNM